MDRQQQLSGRKYHIAALALPIELGLTPTASAAEIPIDQCVGTWSVVVSGLSTDDLLGFFNMNQRATTAPTPAVACANFNRLSRDLRRLRPGDRIKMIGHSGVAAVVHVWITENETGFGNVNAVLLSHPEQPAGSG